jgi:hypothetical protein
LILLAVERDRAEEQGGIVKTGRNSQDLWIGVSRDLLITTL